MDWWSQAAAATQSLLDQYGLLAIALLILVEEAGVPIPLPGDAVMLLAGVGARAGQSNPWIDMATLELATILGATCLYVLASRAGRAVVYRYGTFVHLSPERLNQTETWLQRRGLVAVVLGRLVPGLSILTTLACGVFSIRYRVFLTGLSLGGLVYIAADILLGYFFGPVVLGMLGSVHVPLDALISLIPLGVLIVWLIRARRGLTAEGLPPPAAEDTGRRLRSGAQAGAIAALSAALCLNVLVQLAASILAQASNPLARRFNSRLPTALTADAFLGIVLELVVFVLVGVGWGTLYATTFERRIHVWWIPDAARGALFALLPLAVTLLAERTVIGLGASLGSTAAMIFRAVQGARYLLYGAVLGMTCPIFLRQNGNRAPAEDRVARRSLVS